MRFPALALVALATLALAACGGSSDAGSGGTSRPKPTGTATELRLEVDDGNPVGGPRSFKVTQGDRVRVTLETSGKLRAHLHGYDILEVGDDGDPAVIDFMAEDAGVFELEDEDGGELLATVSVYPG